jgi:DHA1 family bicyclomycin/chloramphenicol resistance-like MFS transporter
MAMLMSIVALSIDAILPALGPISKDFSLADPNDVQLVVGSLLLGLGLGLTLYGPLSDAVGRKKTIYLGTSIFIAGSILSIVSTNFEQMLLGRVLQGFGGAGCRITTLAMVRDRFSGREMGRIMSLIMIIFILVPAIAPSVGQLILLMSDWRGIFGLLIVMGLVSLVWMSLRQKETLAPEKRIKFSLANIYLGTKETLSHPVSRGYMVATGLVFGALVGYLSTAQPISLESPIGDEEDSNLGQLIEDASAQNPAEVVQEMGLVNQTDKALATLTPREEKILRMRFGIGEKSAHTLEEVGKTFNVTRERIRQIEAKALKKLRHPSRSKKLRAYIEE